MSACPSCGVDRPGDAKFCPECGTKLDPRAPTPGQARKVVTVLFSDVVESTALGETLDPEALRRIMSQYYVEMRAAVESHGGTVEKFIGDAVMAVFGVPRLHEDDALRAIRSAMEMQRRLGELNTRLGEEFGIGLAARIGVNTGQVVAGDAGSGHLYVTGDAVNVAARLEQLAEPGEILLGAETWRLTRHAIDSEPVEPLHLKGKAAAVSAHRLRGIRPGTEAFERRLDAPLVGRDRELASLRAALDEAISANVCRLFTLLGPPGIGKSRLAREIANGARDAAVALVGQCLPYGEGITYWPLREIFGRLGALEELDAALAEGAPDDIAWAIRKSLERRARERPLILVFEDVHWAEPTLLDLIEHLADWTRDAPLLLVCLARPELLDDRPAWAAGRSNGQVVSLGPLSAEESDQLMTALLHGPSLDSATRRRLHDVAEGNPLFVEQSLAMLAEEASPDEVPRTIQALLAARLDALPDGERELIERASVIGLEFDWDSLTALSPDSHRPSGTQLAALVRRDMIRPHEGVEDTFRFRHILIGDASYDRMPKEVRADLHERFARWLSGRRAAGEEVVGYHLEQAHRYLTELGPPSVRSRMLAEHAAEQLLVSGRRAEDHGDARATANLLGRAAGLLPADDSRRLKLLPSLGTALRDAGEMDAAEAVLLEAVEADRPAERGVAAAASIALWDLRLHRYPGRYDGQGDVRRAIVAAISVFEELGDKAGLARAFTHRGKLKFWSGQAAAALEDLDRAARLARELGDRVREAESLSYVLATMERGPMPVSEALSRLERLRVRGRGNRRLELTSLAVRAILTAMQGRFDVARGLVAEARLLGAGDQIVLGSVAPLGAGEVELIAGNFEEAERELRAIGDELEHIGELGFLSSVTPLLIDAVLRQGRVDEALTLSDRWRSERLTVPEDADAHVGWRRVRAKALAHSGDVDAGEALAREAIEMAARTDFIGLQARTFADLAEVLRLAGRPAEAADALREAVRRHEQKGNAVEAERLRSQMADLAVP